MNISRTFPILLVLFVVLTAGPVVRFTSVSLSAAPIQEDHLQGDSPIQGATPSGHTSSLTVTGGAVDGDGKTVQVHSALYEDDAIEVVSTVADIMDVDDFVYSGRRWPGDAPVVNFYINVNPGQGVLNGASPADIRDAIVDAAGTWNAVETSAISLQYVGATDTSAFSLNGRNEIFFADVGSEKSLGRSKTWTVAKKAEMVEVDMAINNLSFYDVSGSPNADQVDLRTVVLHELGHWVSLGHDDDEQAVMHATLPKGRVKHSLHANDMEGVSFAYPCETLPCLPSEAEKVVIQPDRTTVHHFSSDSVSKSMRLVVPAGATGAPITIAYEPMPTQPSVLDKEYRFAGYGFYLNAVDGDEIIDDFEFELPATYEVHYGDIDALFIDEETLGLFVDEGEGWRPADCAAYRHAPHVNQFSVSGCELGGLAVFGQLDSERISSTHFTYIPMVQSR